MILKHHLSTAILVSAWFRLFAVATVLTGLQSCASYGQHAATMRDGLMTGRAEIALSIAEEKDPEQKEVLASLDKGMLRRMTGDYTGSNQILEVAKKEIESLYGISVTENLAAVTVNETLRSYVGDRYEQVLLHAFMAMNYIQLDDFDAARVEMLQADVKMKQWGDEPEEDAFVRYLEGIIYESLREYDQALVSYRRAYNIYKEKAGNPYPQPPQILKQDLLRMLAKMRLWSEYKTFKREFGMESWKPPKDGRTHGELVVILNNGLAPIRSEDSVMIFSAEVQHNLRVSFPAYRNNPSVLRWPDIRIDGQHYGMETVEDIDKLARYSLEQAMPGIMARALARAVVKYNTQHQANENSALAGLLMTVTNIATERADTRSWTTLPQAIQMQRIRLPAGEHQVEIAMKDVTGTTVDTIRERVKVKPGRISFLIKHWVAPVPRLPTLAASKADKHETKQK